jgi:hypothetical protein
MPVTAKFPGEFPQFLNVQLAHSPFTIHLTDAVYSEGDGVGMKF